VTVTTLPQLDLITGTAAKQILRKAEKARLPSEFAEILSMLEAEIAVAWLTFGGDGGRDPHSALGAANDPTLLLAEPVMNSIDALFELNMRLAELSGIEPHIPSSPREAAHLLFGLPEEGLAKWDSRKGEDRKLHAKIASMTQVILRSGSRKSTPTITFLDRAIGQHPLDYWRTILSLQLGNKRDVPYQAGQYGHGAGMLLGFCEGGQIMVSRRHPKLRADGQDDLAGLVLVRKLMPSVAGTVNPLYQVMVSKRTGEPIAFDPSALANPQWYGLQRTCIDYELPRSSFQYLYDSFDQVLPHPPLPYELIDERGE
jgi:hypothetical protein